MFDVSVVLISLSSRKFLQESIENIVTQLAKPKEIIVAISLSDNLSTKLIKKYQDNNKGINFLILKELNDSSLGVRLSAIKRATSRYIAFLDSKDVWEDEKIFQQYHFMINHKILFSYTYYSFFYREDIKKEKSCIMSSRESYNLNQLMLHHGICFSSVMIDKDLLKRNITGLNQNKVKDDYLLWLTILKFENVRAYLLPSRLCQIREIKNKRAVSFFKHFKSSVPLNIKFNNSKTKSIYYSIHSGMLLKLDNFSFNLCNSLRSIIRLLK